MNDLIAKLSSYDIFINVIPGAVFVHFLSVTGIYVLASETLVGNLVLYYFSGLIISRIGSVVIEPLLRLLRVVKYGSYNDFIVASEKDPKILILLEASNLYRSILALIVVCAVGYNWDAMAGAVGFSRRTWVLMGCVALVILFTASFKKQNRFITQRVHRHSIAHNQDS
ncbi:MULTISPECIES: hypothetical protein [unclassified Neorhizobium]|uniref:hypothetical protein n=1 Tax=unclassified Neorhizobium TaxID=2629175 RepID=UPI001FF367E5|nr:MULTISPECIES: hypothetical protein [unclassified Neorhizobium]MCJ9668537.1 hypothetical protein [Neorhizobium sp. SHOUNA12B]MCJ9744240.1 hypothetical protein [Neorhizobium sp. SHOUNA12A]